MSATTEANMRRITWILALLLSAGVLVAAGCGDDEDEGGGGGAAATPEATEEAPAEEESGGGGETLTLTADPGGDISWEPAELSAPAGSVTIRLVSESPDVPHAVEVEGNGIEESSEQITGGETELTVDLEAGEYTFYCPVGQHRQNGMEGTLTVE
jgi:plastocyanin